MMMALAGALRTIWVGNNMHSDQDKGIAHCLYIRRLAMEIWTKENSRPSGKRIGFEEAIKHALELHVKKLIQNNMTIKKPIPPILPKSNLPKGMMPIKYCEHGW